MHLGRLLLFLGLMCFVFPAVAQRDLEETERTVTVKKKNPETGKEKGSVSIGGMIKLNGIIDFNGLRLADEFNITLIPVRPEDKTNDIRFNMDMRQTRLVFVGDFDTEKKAVGKLKSYIEGDFYGLSGAFRLRHAYVSTDYLLIGRYWSIFSDLDTWPNVVDFDGPVTGIWTRNEQIRVKLDVEDRWEFRFGLETPAVFFPNRVAVIDSSVAPTFQRMPDITGYAKYRFGRNTPYHLQWSWVFRELRYVEGADEKSASAFAFGGALSGTFACFKEDKFIFQAVMGKGISRYMVSFAAQRYDALPTTKGSLEALPTFGGYLAYEHQWWDAPFKSTMVLGYAYIDLPKEFETLGPRFAGGYGSANLFWYPFRNFQAGMEYLVGWRRITTGEFDFDDTVIVDQLEGVAHRIEFMTQYNF